MAHVGVVGFSWGGMTNVFAASRDNRISALVSFDGTREPEQTRRISPYKVALPWLYIQRHPQTIAELSAEGIETSFSLLNELKYSNIYQVVMYPMQHMDFSSAALRLERPSWFAEYSRAEVEMLAAWPKPCCPSAAAKPARVGSDPVCAGVCRMYPDNANLFDSLGEAQEANHELPAAIASYRRALELARKVRTRRHAWPRWAAPSARRQRHQRHQRLGPAGKGRILRSSVATNCPEAF